MQMKNLDRAFETLLLDEPSENILRITINRPDAANALITQMGQELIDVFTAVTANPLTYRCLVFTAAGNRIFCAGADLKERDGMSDAQFQSQHYLFERMIRAIWECPVPVIAALNGHTMAGGLELALGCDFAYAADHAKFGFPEVKRGIMPGGAGTQHLPRRIGEARAKELILTGATFSAKEALEWGVVNRLCPSEELMDVVMDTVKAICANAPLSTAQAKKSITHGLQMDLRTGMFFEIEAYNRLIPTEDRQEGINAFVEKREAVFKGR
ncbi:enoyl-CoA hydratase-related protein [Vreelandella titanicae]|uniref:enoyl-CoA hydratase/isomerase family protein n=1 Tax=Vreelandella titanicae TaxID=664683 RepID=UPI003159D814